MRNRWNTVYSASKYINIIGSMSEIYSYGSYMIAPKAYIHISFVTCSHAYCTQQACDLFIFMHLVVCPKPTGPGICVESCPVGVLCGPGMKCCSNGCGHVCTNATDCAVSVLWEHTI